MNLLQIALLISALLVILVAGIVLTFAIVVMPGIRKLGDREYLQAFKVMDRVIQDNQPLFMVVWIGSLFAVFVTAVMGIFQLSGMARILILATFILYFLGVMLPTATINVPLNNRLQALDLSKAEEGELEELSRLFEQRWVKWNTIRTAVAVVVGVILLIVGTS